MRIDESSLAFHCTANGAGNPNWSIALGQSHPSYKINLSQNPGIEDILIGMTYCAVPIAKVTTKMGKGGRLVSGSDEGTPIVSAALFTKVYVNDIKIESGKFILLIDKDQSETHSGRLRLRYSKHNTYHDGTSSYSNDQLYRSVQDVLELANDACWFVYDISVDNQDTLRMRAVVVNKDGPMTYASSSELHAAWGPLIEADLPLESANDDHITQHQSIEVFYDDIPKDLSLEDLGSILKEMYDVAIGGKVTAIHMFGLKYGSIIKDKSYSIAEIIRVAGISDSYNVEISKGINIYKMIKDNEYGVCFYDKEKDTTDTHSKSVFDFDSVTGKAINKIFYGTPGCGKSYYIEHYILGKDEKTKKYSGAYKKENIVRTTFYQDYSNTDFVGQILPKVVRGIGKEKDTVEYAFNPGPFTLALIQAICNPKEKVALVIEEINRGNAPAIFGDVFQLLDRDINGVSEYGIVNVSLMDYLNDYEFVVDGESKKYTFTEIKIPGNLDIFATMNTSDQNVYTLDTAFIRRWDKEKIKNTFSQCTFASTVVPGMANYTWKEFVDGINRWIAKHLEDLQVNEDKQIGVFFVKESLLTNGDAEKFAFKVFDYLWSDVAKLDRGIFFNHYDTLEDLIKAYKTIGVGVFKSGIFETKAITLPQSEANDEQ